MNRVTEKKQFGISPQRRGADGELLVATATNAKEVYYALVGNVSEPSSSFFRDYKGELTASKEAVQELYGISDRTYQYWGNDDKLKPKINHHAVILLSLDSHPDLAVVSR